MAQPADADAEAAPEAAPDAAEARQQLALASSKTRTEEAWDASKDAHTSESLSEPDEPPIFPRRMTPMEYDLQLQVTERILRDFLEGKRTGLHPTLTLESAQAQYCSQSWMVANRMMRIEVEKQMRADGENTPEWTESRDGMSDLAWEVLAQGRRGEVLRSLGSVDRTEVQGRAGRDMQRGHHPEGRNISG